MREPWLLAFEKSKRNKYQTTTCANVAGSMLFGCIAEVLGLILAGRQIRTLCSGRPWGSVVASSGDQIFRQAGINEKLVGSSPPSLFPSRP